MLCCHHLEIVNNFIVELVSCKWSPMVWNVYHGRGDKPGQGTQQAATRHQATVTCTCLRAIQGGSGPQDKGQALGWWQQQQRKQWRSIIGGNSGRTEKGLNTMPVLGPLWGVCSQIPSLWRLHKFLRAGTGTASFQAIHFVHKLLPKKKSTHMNRELREFFRVWKLLQHGKSTIHKLRGRN